MVAERSETVEWLKKWFTARNGTRPVDIENNYFEAGLIDSMAVVELILEIEKKFGMRFKERHFQDRRFATIKGLADIIGEIKSAEASK